MDACKSTKSSAQISTDVLSSQHDYQADAILALNTEDVRTTAIKPAWRGRGLIVRLEAPKPFPLPIYLSAPNLGITRAWHCDARERDIAPLPVTERGVMIAMESAIATVRLELEPTPGSCPAP